MSHNTEIIAQQLRQSGYRLTPQRQFILDAVCDIGGHVTPDSVFQHVQTRTSALNLTTVYRNLQFLTEQKILTETHLGNGKLGYEMADNHLHHHLACTECGLSLSIEHGTLEDFYVQMASQHGFHIEMNHITFRGLCKSCISAENPQS